MDGSRLWGHTNLVSLPIIADHGAGGMGAVTKAIPRRRGISAGSVPPVVVMIGLLPIPAPVMVFQGGMIPGKAGIISGQCHPLALYSQGPDLIRPNETEVGFYARDFKGRST